MKIFGEPKPSLDGLAHYGVKGMKWGLRKDRPIGGRADRILYGKKGVRKLKKQVARGKTPRQARRSQIGRVANRAVITAYGVAVARNVILVAGSLAATRVVNNRAAKAGTRHAANMMADGRGLTSYSTISLAFNPVTNTWE